MNLCLLTPLNWEEQVASPLLARTRRLRRVQLLPPATGRLAQPHLPDQHPLALLDSSWY